MLTARPVTSVIQRVAIGCSFTQSDIRKNKSFRIFFNSESREGSNLESTCLSRILALHPVHSDGGFIENTISDLFEFISYRHPRISSCTSGVLGTILPLPSENIITS